MWWHRARTEKLVPSGVPIGVATQMQEQRDLPPSATLAALEQLRETMEQAVVNAGLMIAELERLRAENASLLAMLAYRQVLS